VRWPRPIASGRSPIPTVAWTRLHGVVSLEIEGSFAPMGVDPALLYASEVDQLVAQASQVPSSSSAWGLT
jgi:hypothetical protein